MSSDFQMMCSADTDRRIMRIKAAGEIDSTAYVDRCIAFYQGVEQSWLYDRLYDQSDCTGFVAFEDLDRLVRAMAPVWSQAPVPPRVALVNARKLASARFPMVTRLVAKPNHRLFDTVAEAESWLAEPRYVPEAC